MNIFCAVLIVFLVPCLQAQNQKKNVLFISIDDLRPQIAAFLNEDGDRPQFLHPKMVTPNLDKLAARSLMLINNHVQQAVCGPSRASALTGRRPDTTHVYDLDAYWRNVGGNFTTIPQYFKENGYESVGMGKIFHPGGSSGNNDPLSWTRAYYNAPNDKLWNQRLNNSWLALADDVIERDPLPDTQLKDRAIENLREFAESGNAFFLAVGFHRPHLPLLFPESVLINYNMSAIRLPNNPYAPVDMPNVAWSYYPELRNYYDIDALNVTGDINTTLPYDVIKDLRRAYYASVTYVDSMLGQVLQELEDLGLSSSTIISVWSDHGWQLGEHGEWCKHTNFEVSTRAPMMIHIPGVTEQGIVASQFTESVDLFPTLVEAAGLPALQVCPENSTFVPVCTEGSSLLPLLNGTNIWKSRVFSQHSRGTFRMGYSMRTSDFRYTEWVGFTSAPDYQPDWDDLRGAELYDHRTDWQENVNRAEDPDYEYIREELQHHLHRGWRYAWD